MEYILAEWEEFERNCGSLETWMEFERKQRKAQKREEERKERERKRSEMSGQEVEGDVKRVKVEEDAKRAKVETPTERKRKMKEKKEDPEVQKRTVFVNNLSFAANEDQIREHFGKHGSIVDVNIVRNNHGKSRGFAYVEFEKEEEAKKAVSENGNSFLNRKMEVKLSVPQEERKVEKKESNSNHEAIACTIYVSGLPTGVSEYEFSVFFSKVDMQVEIDV